MRYLLNISLLLSIAITLAFMPATAQDTGAWEDNTCFECHDAEMALFSGSSHHLIIAKTENLDSEDSCNACHGDPEEHNEEPELTNILTARLTPLKMSEKCISCHEDAGRSNLLAVSDHAELKVANCVSCHSAGHYEETAAPLLLSAPQTLCSSCHQTERAQFEMPYAHKDLDGPMSCTACHSIHDQDELFSLNNYGDNRLCSKCHEDKAGPYLFPHAVNEIDACSSCHNPHGSTTPFLLTRPNSTQLCMECHTDFFIVHREPAMGLQSCVQCHAEIHGSQRDHLLFQP